MLYKNIIVLPLAIQTFLPHAINGGTYAFYASSGDTSCSLAGPNDICEFHCDEEKQTNSFDCGNAGQCEIFCEKKECIRTGSINATNADFLQFNSPGSNCAKGASFFLPSFGNVSLSAWNNGLKQTKVYSGSNTQNIYIDCYSNGDANDDCKDMIVNAQNAQYLEIYIGAGELENAIINCPINSTYKGQSMAPCMIDATGNGMFINTQINTVNGVPIDLWIIGTNRYSGTVINCAGGSSNVSNIQQNDACWNTRAPTIAPTQLTLQPTDNPISAPTTINPTTTNPTTVNPTTSASVATTFMPTTSDRSTSIPTTSAPTVYITTLSTLSETSQTRTPSVSTPTTVLSAPTTMEHHIIESTLLHSTIALTLYSSISNDGNIFAYILYIGLGVVCCCVCCLCFMIGIGMNKHPKDKKFAISNDKNRLRIPSLSVKQQNEHKNKTVPNLQIKKRLSLIKHSLSRSGKDSKRKLEEHLHIPDDSSMLCEMVNNTKGGTYEQGSIPKYSAEMIYNESNNEGINMPEKRKTTNGHDEYIRQQIKLWLTNSVGLPEYFSTFIENGYDTFEFIKSMETKMCLEEIGIDLKGHQNKIWVEIQNLKNVCNVAVNRAQIDRSFDIVYNENPYDEELYEEAKEKPTPGGTLYLDTKDIDLNKEGL